MASPPPPGALDADAAIKAIDAIMTTIAGTPGAIPAGLAPLTVGKVYELYVLGWLLEQLTRRGWWVSFHGQSIVMKGSPGAIQPSDAHFKITHHTAADAEIRTDIEVMTLSHEIDPVSGASAYHEVDIVIVPAGTLGRPAHDKMLLGIECKAVANFRKAIVREVLGRRRELSYATDDMVFECLLDDQMTMVRAHPASEYWLTYIDPKGDDYAEGPSRFGVEFYHVAPP